ncbi:MAG TPA: NAD(P)H-dependent oxidoreductase [Steroidobacteraceae bacterium]|nr:NAD(P)H-dependent oxidoreductase [Steroidobacteraceae bacterium]
MSDTLNVVVLVGSLRKESYTRRLAQALIKLAPATLKMEIVPIGELPLYNQDLESDAPPPPWRAFRDRVRPADGALFATPEYNRALPAVLKNAIDVGSRPYGKSVWSGKPAAIVSNSPGMIGGFGANHQLRQSLVFLDMPILQQPEAYIGGSDKLFDERGEFVNPTTRDLCTRLVTTFEAWIRATRKPK